MNMADRHTDLDSNVEPDECPSKIDLGRTLPASQLYSKVGVAVSDECGEHLYKQATLAEIGSCQDKELNQPNQHTNGVAVRDERGKHMHEQFQLVEVESCKDKEPHGQKENVQETKEIAQRLSDICLHEQAIEHGTETLNAERTGDIEKHIIDDFTYTCIDAEGDTPLHLAIICLFTIEQIYCIINTILKRFPDHDVLNHQNDKYRQTPLHLAVHTGRTDIVRCLLGLGAQTTLQDSQLRTPAHIACLKGDRASLNALLEADDNEPTRCVSFYDNQGQTCLHTAVLNRKCELVHIL
ncbi:hypothetical protein DPMN_127075 [Dreissena polymorpha]|uniref:Uncharacterized protein n=1 Tax=Dreissena polymorpha TaxID=45954 RepID=A0A9D4JV38_DREPO|nr:hypothetical protein DPMN_127075 [Dreissena polymorpha]